MLLKRFRINLFSKLFLFSIGIVTVTLLIGLVFNLIFLDGFYIERQKSSMLNIVKEIEEFHKERRMDKIDTLLSQVKEIKGIEVRITDFHPHSKMMMRHNSYFIHVSPEDSEKFKIMKIPELGSTVLFYSKKLDENNLLILTTSLSVMSAHTHEMYIFNLLTGIIALFFSAVVGAIFSRRITKDLAKLNNQAEKIANLNFSEKLRIDRDDELGDLGKSIEKMAEKLSISIENMKNFVSNASHELKTPISVLCTHAHALVRNQVAETDKKSYYEILLKEGIEMKELTQNLLTISKMNSPEFTLKREKIDLKEIFIDSLEKYDFIELEKDITVNLNISNVITLGDSYLIKLAINNIINNSLKYSPKNSNIDIYSVKNKIYISNIIENHINNNIETLWQPFTRGTNAQEGTIEGSGLGLSIIKKALDLNSINSSISIENGNFIFCMELLEVADEN